MTNEHTIHIFINQDKFSLENSKQSGQSIKEQASIPLNHVLLTGHGKHDEHDRCDEHHAPDTEDSTEISNDQVVVLKHGQHFWSHDPQAGISVTINRDDYHFGNPVQTGQALKERAGIDLADVLFLSRTSEDEVVPNDTEITLHCGDCFYSSPPANYGSTEITPNDVGCDQFECIPQPGGWQFLIIPNFHLPNGFSHDSAQLLIKLPPCFPDAAPDMFWVNPHVKTQSGATPQGTSVESLLGEQWQRFSWHLGQGAWRPGISTLRDFMRCIRSRFERRN